MARYATFKFSYYFSLGETLGTTYNNGVLGEIHDFGHFLRISIHPTSLGVVWIEKMILLLIFWYLTSMWPLEVEVCRPLDDNILLSNAGNELELQVDNSIRQNSENELIFSKWPRTTLKYIHENWTIISSNPKYNRIGNLIFSQLFYS